ncbi:LicD family protein [Desulfovermiculus halophilus]|jgi:phosphorylcholine metabolism protein LicD|uniref:LicD family protein n=1 Tax=Desulfovermiculus halophilus TaxID=339722 RepID=UPI0012947909|nr:LicD family protein [Desulfovermiculus halophilus]
MHTDTTYTMHSGSKKMLIRTADILESLNIAYWLESGTLLSLWRENGISGWHTNIDLGIEAKDLPTLRAAQKDLPRLFRMKLVADQTGREWTGQPISRAKIMYTWQSSHKNPLCVNITIKHKTDSEYRWVDHKTCKAVPAHLLVERSRVVIDGRAYPVPKKPEAYLRARYGEWKTPKRYWFSTIDDCSIASEQRLAQVPFKPRQAKSQPKPVLTGNALDNMKKFLLRTIDIFNQVGVRYWLDDGTLLGIMREGDLIPWDNDVDLGIAGESVPLVLRSRYRFLPQYILIPKTGHTPWLPTSCRKFKFGSPLRQIERYVYRYLPLLPHRPKTPRPWGDLIAKYRVGDEYVWLDCGMLKKVPAKFFDRLDTIQWEGRTVCIPAHVEEYLQIRYGNWREPDPSFRTGLDDSAIAERGI